MIIGDAYTFNGRASTEGDSLIAGEVVDCIILIDIYFVNRPISNHEPLAIPSHRYRCLNIYKATNGLSMVKSDAILDVDINVSRITRTSKDCAIIRDSKPMNCISTDRLWMGLEKH